MNDGISVQILTWILTVNFAGLIALLGFGYKIIRFFNRMEFKMNLMWGDYEFRVHGIERRSEAHDNGTEGK